MRMLCLLAGWLVAGVLNAAQPPNVVIILADGTRAGLGDGLIGVIGNEIRRAGEAN